MTIKEILAKIDKLRKELDSLKPIKKADEERLWKKFRLDWNYNSNHIEGNTLTYGQTELLLIFDKATGEHDMREYEEMKAHDVALHMIRDMAADQEHPLTESIIKELNKIMLVQPYWKEAITSDGQPTRKLIKAGDYKDTPNSVRLQSGEIFHYAEPDEVRPMMQELMEFYRTHDASTETHPVWLAAMFHYKFVRIHPFDDGNGRIARLIMNYILMKKGYPPAIVQSEDKKNYLLALNKADTGDLESFVIYIGEQLVRSLEISIKAAKGESIEEPADLDKRLAILDRELKSVDPDREIKQLFSRDVFFEMYDGWISRLLKDVIPMVQTFNKYFTGTNHSIIVNNGMGAVSFVNEEPEEVISKLREECEKNKDRIKGERIKFSFSTFYGTFIKGGLDTFGCNYGFDVSFRQTEYRVTVDVFVKEAEGRNSKEQFRKLLHKQLSDEEIKEITLTLKSTIIDHIDETTRKRGIR